MNFDISKKYVNDLLTAPIIRSRSGGIDFLRGFFALWVVFAHLVPWSVQLAGHVDSNYIQSGLNFLFKVVAKIFQTKGETHPAVLGFIVLSGYCIHRNGARLGSDFSFLGYAVRRFFRIGPVYLLATILGVGAFKLYFSENAIAATSLSGTPELLWSCMAVKLTGLSAFYPPLHACSFQGNAPLTTAMVEMWLYVLYAVVMSSFFRRGDKSKAFYLIALFYFIAIAIVAARPSFAGWWNNGSIFSFAAYWWIGAMFVREEPPPYAFVSKVFLAWLFLSCLMVFGVPGSILLIEPRKLILAVLFGALISNVDHRERPWYYVGSRIGLAGYSIYALHAPLLIFLLIYGINAGAVLLTMLGAAGLVHYIFERPLTEYGRKWGARIAKRNRPSPQE